MGFHMSQHTNKLIAKGLILAVAGLTVVSCNKEINLVKKHEFYGNFGTTLDQRMNKFFDEVEYENLLTFQTNYDLPQTIVQISGKTKSDFYVQCDEKNPQKTLLAKKGTLVLFFEEVGYANNDKDLKNLMVTDGLPIVAFSKFEPKSNDSQNHIREFIAWDKEKTGTVICKGIASPFDVKSTYIFTKIFMETEQKGLFKIYTSADSK
jgi:hypothetical protein